MTPDWAIRSLTKFTAKAQRAYEKPELLNVVVFKQ
jgi:hypothetical protein